jgi:hypothetical protein
LNVFIAFVTSYERISWSADLVVESPLSVDVSRRAKKDGQICEEDAAHFITQHVSSFSDVRRGGDFVWFDVSTGMMK